jgi:hypothetical protein
MKAAIHWFSMMRASAGGILKAIEIKATRTAITSVSTAFLTLKLS